MSLNSGSQYFRACSRVRAVDDELGVSDFYSSLALSIKDSATRNVRLQAVDEGYHPLALDRIGQGAAHGAEIVGHVRRVGGAGNDRCDPFVGEQVLEEELGPAAGEVLRPIGNRLAAYYAEQAAVTKGQRRQHAGLDLGRQRQDALFRFAVVE